MQENEQHIVSQYIGQENRPVIKIGDTIDINTLVAKNPQKNYCVYSTVKGRVVKITRNSIFVEQNPDVAKHKPKNTTLQNRFNSQENHQDFYSVKNQKNHNFSYHKNYQASSSGQNSQINQQVQQAYANDSQNNSLQKNVSKKFDYVKNRAKNLGTQVVSKNIFSTQNPSKKNSENNKDTEAQQKIDSKEKASKKPVKRLNVDALDGFRTLAIVSVILYHLNFGWCKGGLLGVTLFFVLSGYLITGILKTEIESTGKVSLKRFWIHRIRRLFPAIAIVVVVVAPQFFTLILKSFV